MRRYFVYILANANRALYVGVTNDLIRRIQQHQNHQFASYTAKHNISILVYFEEFSDIRDAIHREKQIKGYRRAKKITFTESQNSH